MSIGKYKREVRDVPGVLKNNIKRLLNGLGIFTAQSWKEASQRKKKEEGPSGIAHGCDSISLYGIVSQLKER